MNAIPHHRRLLVIATLILGALSCGLPGGAAPALTAGPPATPAVFLPVAWTATPAAPTREIPLGWKEYSGGWVHISLPESFEGGDVETLLQASANDYKSLGPYFTNVAQTIQEEPDVFVLWAFDPLKGPSGYVTFVTITRYDVPTGTTIEEYIGLALDSIPSEMQVVDQGVAEVGAYEAAKFVLATNYGGQRAITVVYAIVDGDRFWDVTYGTGADEFVTRSPIWEQSIATFWLGK